jgi:hypothetical protein
MRTRIDEPAINFALMKDIKAAEKAGVIHPNAPLDTEIEEKYLSELERVLRVLDEVENYVAVKTLVEHHKQLFVRILDYMNKEGENTQ